MYKAHTWIEIDFDALDHNINAIKRYLSPQTDIMAVVKADAYGHGAVEISQYLVKKGIKYLAVSVLSEGIELRQAGIKVPILVFNYIPEENCDLVMQYDLIPTIYTRRFAILLNEIAQKWDKQVPVHINIDTGMHRLGVLSENLTKFLAVVKDLTHLRVTGVYSHFASADEADLTYTQRQLAQFNDICKIFPNCLIHFANSAALLKGIATDFDLVRVGAAMYGFYPSLEMKKAADQALLKPILSFKTVIGHLKILKPNSAISYGGAYITKKTSLIATLPVGYADGYRRMLSHKAQVLIHGQRVPVVGNICMDQCMVDVSAIPDVKVGDEVVLFGCQGDQCISLDEVAQWCNTISYEVPCLINRRVPRYYWQQGKMSGYRGHLQNL